MSVEFKDYYATLEVPRTASADDVKKAFRKLARKYHPDVAKDKKAAEKKFKEINEAHEVLSDPEKRKQYDELGADWQNGGQRPPPRRRHAGPQGVPGQDFHFGGTGFSDFFEQFFGAGSRGGFNGGPATARVRKGNDIEGDLLVTLDEAMHGTVRSLSLEFVNPQTGQPDTRTFQVRIPPGATDGRRIRVPGQGEPGHGGGAAGDLFLRVRHAAHPDFYTREHDLYHELEVAPWEAVLGMEVVVPTLDGSIKLRIPPGTASGKQLRVRGRGLPKGKTGERGDFHVIVTVVLPTKLTDEERTLWEKLRDISSFHPRANP